MKNINFIKDRINYFKKKAVQLYYLRMVSFIVVATYALLVFAVFSYKLLLRKQNEVLNTQIKSQENTITNLQKTEAKQIYLTSKIKSLTQIVGSKKENQAIIESVLGLLPEGAAVDNFSIDEKGTVNFAVSCTDFKILEQFLGLLEQDSDKSKLKIRKAVINGISYGLNKNYNLGMQISFYLPERE